VTGRLVSRTGRTMVYPVGGLVLLTLTLVAFAFAAGSLGTATLAVLMLWIGLCFGTVMGVVQVTVQTASGPAQLGEAAASVQFSRSIGAAFGTALVATVLFAVLTVRNPDAARVFSAMVEHGGPLATPLMPEQRVAIQADIASAFRAAFLTMAAFTAAGFFLAVTNPLKRI